MLKNKHILLGVTGGIAAYKAAFLVRLLVKEGAVVRVVMTDSAKAFVTPLTLATLSKNKVYTDFFNAGDGVWENHVELGLWADVFLIAPATANTLAKMAAGICDNLLMACFLSAKCPVVIAPAMDVDMFGHPATRQNLRTLLERDVTIIDSPFGELASGLIGEGRMAEPEAILEKLNSFFPKDSFWKDKKVLITAGPTYEAIDPVRFIGNHSSGKMGFALAEQACNAGAEVVLISGPVVLEPPKGIFFVKVTSAMEMKEAVATYYESFDIAIMAAAVADYRPKQKVNHKIKKTSENLEVELEKTEDILNWMGINKKHQVLIGFALETENLFENGKQKLKNKNLDFIVLNTISDPGAGFGVDTNKISILDKHNNLLKFELKPKTKVAEDILNVVAGRLDVGELI